jgi:AbrB family looped-hinge helix DNA binding protein
MLTVTLSTKGQLSIPSSIRRAHDWDVGVRFSITDTGNQLILKPIGRLSSLKVEDVAGCIAYHGPKVSLDKMSEAPHKLAAKVK